MRKNLKNPNPQDLKKSATPENENSRLGMLLPDLIDVIDIGMWELDMNYRVVSMNRKACEIYGKNAKGSFCYRVAAKRDEICPECPVEKVFGGSESGRSEHKRKDIHGNVIYIDHIATPIKDKNGNLTGGLVLINDMTRYKETEKKLRKANKRMVLQQKVVAKEERGKLLLQMAGTTAQELIQPLSVLTGSVELMRRNINDAHNLGQQITEVEELGAQISDITQKLNAISCYDKKDGSGNSSVVAFDKEIHILSVEDSYLEFSIIKSLLKKNRQFTLTWSRSIKKAFHELEKNEIDLILLDYMLNDENGLYFLKRLTTKGYEIPVIVVTGKGGERIASKFIRAGAYDYLPKEMLNKKNLLHAISSTMETHRIQNEIKDAQKMMIEMATRDELTKLHNRRFFINSLEHELGRAIRYETELVLAIIDVDRFREINNMYGHSAGDMVLIGLSHILRECFRVSDIFCRYGSDQFTIILLNTDAKHGKIVCERFRKKVANYKFEWNEACFSATVSVGIVGYNNIEDRPLREMINAADLALSQAKEEGGNKVAEYAIIY